MLPLPNLDDRDFEQLVDEALKLVPQYTSEWTDFNAHDPGVMLVELFAWLTEMQQYYMGQIRDKNHLKYLKLIGASPMEASSAVTLVTFTSPQNSNVGVIPKGTMVKAGEVVYETTEPLMFLNVGISKIISSYSSGRVDNTLVNRRNGLSFYAFGELAEVDSRLYIGFSDVLTPGQDVSLTFNMFENYPAALREPVAQPQVTNCLMDELETPGKIDCPYMKDSKYCLEYFDKNNKWTYLEIKSDETVNLSKSGRITFTVPSDMEKYAFRGIASGCIFVRLRVTEEFELAPLVNEILLNTVPVIERQTLCEALTYGFDPVAKVPLTDPNSGYLYCAGTYFVQLKKGGENADGEKGLWKDYSDTVALAAVVPSDAVKIRFIYQSHQLYTLDIGKSSGLPMQSMKLPFSKVIPGKFMLQVREGSETGFSWRDWERVEDFDSSGKLDYHYILDEEKGEVLFGDGINGRVPAVTDDDHDNIRVVQYIIGGGEIGNAAKGAINQVVQPFPRIRLNVENHFPAIGGRDRESIDSAKIRARKSIKEIEYVLTSAEIEAMALKTPELRVARAKTYVTDESMYSGSSKETKVVNLVVVPYSNKPMPVPGKRFMLDVYRFLDTHRVVTTELRVVPPVYVRVSLGARVFFKPGYITSVDIVVSRLKGFLAPLDMDRPDRGWPFGKGVYVSEIYSLLESIEGVEYIENVRISASGRSFAYDKAGNLVIRPDCLVYPGDFRIEVFNNSFDCPLKRRGRTT